ncbi:uncharacterized protein MYCFIDRAFT_175133 [Pseudocercospora fijiensis CIRAD86]|uniref:Uncharacterized protein n=1 Tax=Pseudocercospora fijiensis (strain CIRAD86) TaxID=383855 RepID=M3AGM2_PSEFD|nr:uncharacterized protein MYCFIDRAFT_175133 [Pseudocercospora fijiensis CIRAD86]EME83711.1 hypothetical protein MYCFIDRAFT_175133 [Pseudocercospora fijiensis CIRAD86]
MVLVLVVLGERKQAIRSAAQAIFNVTALQHLFSPRSFQILHLQLHRNSIWIFCDSWLPVHSIPTEILPVHAFTSFTAYKDSTTDFIQGRMRENASIYTADLLKPLQPITSFEGLTVDVDVCCIPKETPPYDLHTGLKEKMQKEETKTLDMQKREEAKAKAQEAQKNKSATPKKRRDPPTASSSTPKKAKSTKKAADAVDDSLPPNSSPCYSICRRVVFYLMHLLSSLAALGLHDVWEEQGSLIVLDQDCNLHQCGECYIPSQHSGFLWYSEGNSRHPATYFGLGSLRSYAIISALARTGPGSGFRSMYRMRIDILRFWEHAFEMGILAIRSPTTDDALLALNGHVPHLTVNFGKMVGEDLLTAHEDNWYNVIHHTTINS